MGTSTLATKTKKTTKIRETATHSFQSVGDVLLVNSRAPFNVCIFANLGMRNRSPGVRDIVQMLIRLNTNAGRCRMIIMISHHLPGA